MLHKNTPKLWLKKISTATLKGGHKFGMERISSRVYTNSFKKTKKMEKILEKKAVKRVRNIISKFDSNLSIIVLNNTARTAKDASNSLGCEIGAIVKSLLFKVEEYFLICLVAGDKRCSLNKLKKILNKKDVRMASANEVKENTGFSIGGVSPVGHIKKLDVLIDKSLDRFKHVFAAGGHPNCIFKINYSDLVKITDGLEKELSE